MAQITPYYDDIRDLTFTATVAVVGGTLVEATPGQDRRCRPAGAASSTVLGVAAYDAPVGGKVTILKQQMVPLVAGTGGVTAGAKLVSDAAANAVALGAAAATDARQIVGQALEDKAAGSVFRAFVF